ncbi:MAG: hypothetical protein RBS40_15490 [Rhodocyclaceae bacterium]|jgi:hypothetical protein|nr:hypothetical protein [Rhodocyclaceae bacterium]
MSLTEKYFEQSELALAAYAKNLFSGISGDNYRAALEDEGDGMSPSQADSFAENWRVLDQYNDDTTGLSATIFQKVVDGNPTGPKYLAIRGTEPEANDLITDGLLGLGLPASQSPVRRSQGPSGYRLARRWRQAAWQNFHRHRPQPRLISGNGHRRRLLRQR